MADTPVPTPEQMARLWRSKYDEMDETRKRTKAVRDWLAGKVDPVVPKDFVEATKMGIKLPHAVTLALHTVQLLSHKRPRLRRTAIGKSVTSRRKASELELWVNAALETIEDQHGDWWRPLVDMLFNQGCAAVLCFPSPAGWENWPEFLDSENNVRSLFARNRDGLDAESPSVKGKLVVNKRKSKEAYDEYLVDWKARNIPIVIRVIGVDQCLPVLGPGHRLDGLIVRSQYSEEDLRSRGYRWRFGDGHVGVGFDPDAQTKRGLYPQFTLYEFWQPGRVVYYVGQGTTAPAADGSNITSAYKVVDGTERQAVVDLQADFGISRLPGIWTWGSNFASETDPDLRGVPFLWPFLSVFHGMNNLATAKLAHHWEFAYGGWFIEANAEAPPELVMEKGRPRKLKIEPMKAQYIAGKPAPAVHPGVNHDSAELLELMLGAVKEEGPNSAAGGGAGATSGHDRSLIRAMLEDAYSDVLDGALEAAEFVGEMTAEIGDRLVEHFKTTVPVYVSTRPEGAKGVTRQALELTQDMTDGVYDFDAEYPPEQGENLPYAQLLMQWSIEHRIPLRQALEKGMADEAPDETMIEIMVERLLFETPQGQQYLYELAAQEIGDERMRELFQAQQSGQATPDGTPTAALPAPGGGGAPTGQLAGAGPMPIAANSALGGIVAGGLQTAAMRRDALASMAMGGAQAPPQA
jgi:hypothetical protein